jgi:hypothetical protein
MVKPASVVAGFFILRRRIHMSAQAVDLEKPSFWQQVFLQSKVNGAPYHGDRLSGHNWNWPKDTYLQRRLRYLRSCNFVDARNDMARTECRG